MYGTNHALATRCVADAADPAISFDVCLQHQPDLHILRTQGAPLRLHRMPDRMRKMQPSRAIPSVRRQVTQSARLAHWLASSLFLFGTGVTPAPAQPTARSDASARPVDATVKKSPTSQPTSQRKLPRGFSHQTVRMPDGSKRKYVIFVPPQYAMNEAHRWPVIVCLHGSGEKGRDGFRHTTVGLPVQVADRALSFPFIVVMPQAQQMWFRGEEAAAVWAILEDVHARYRTDRDRVYLTGISMGGIGTWELAVIRPDVFAAIVPICGFAPKDYLRNIVDLPTWVFHGALDRNVPVSGSREAVDELKRLGGSPIYTEYPRLQHKCWDEAYSTPDLYRWMIRQRRRPTPKVIDYSFPGGISRVWWLAIEAAPSAKKPVHVHAEIKDDGRIEMTSEGVIGWAIISDADPLPAGRQIDVTWNGQHVYRGPFNGVLAYEPPDAARKTESTDARNTHDAPSG